MIGTTLSHFKIAAKLGEGGMGAVYLAEDLDLKRTVALKVLPVEFANDPERLERFQREAEALASIDHPHIVGIHSIEEADGVRFFTMQHVEGRKLGDVIPEEGLDLESFFDLAIPMADALCAAHERGVLHRDLKPDNVMVDSAGRARILDFGLAKLSADESDGADSQMGTEMLTEEGRILGTVAYMSPEQAQGRTLDPRSDIFSLGILLHEMATGRRPFGGDNQVAMLSSVVKDSPPSVCEIRPDLPEQLARIVRRALEKEPGERYQSASALLDALSDLREESRTGLVTARPSTPAPTRAGRRAGLVAIAVLAIALLVWGLNLGGLRGRPSPGDSRPVATVDEIPTIAVLPFQNLSADPDNEYFSSGLTEELLSKLARIEGFRVRGTPTGWVRGEVEGAEALGRRFGVGYILQGGVRKAGDTVRITAQLVDTNSEFHLWSREFDGTLEDVFGVQEETALRIADALNVELSETEEAVVRDRYTENPEAYDAYLRGWALIESFHVDHDRAEERLTAAERHFAQALELDESYPLAIAGLAMVESYTYYLGVDDSRARIDKTEALARRALELDPELPQALVALGQVGWFREEHRRSIEHFTRALEHDPDNGYVWCELAASCINRDPPDIQLAEDAARKAITYQPGYAFGHLQLGTALALQQRFDEAIPAYEHALELNPDLRTAMLGLGDAQAELGRYQNALSQYERAFEIRPTPYLLTDVAAMHAALGEREESLETLERAVDLGLDAPDLLEDNPHFDLLRDDPAFVAIVEAAELAAPKEVPDGN